MGAYGLLYSLAGGDFFKIESATNAKLYEAFMYLTYKTLEAKEMKRLSKR